MKAKMHWRNKMECDDCSILSNKNRLIAALIEVNKLINSSLDIQEIRQRAIECAAAMTDCEAASIIFLDTQESEMYFDAASGDKAEAIKTIRLKFGEGIAGWVAATRTPVIVTDVQKDPRFFKAADAVTGFETKNMICVPILDSSKDLLGVLQVINKRNGDFQPEDLTFMETFSDQVAISVENARLHEELKRTFYETVHAFAETIEMRDPYTGGHTKRVMEYSLAIGEKMGLNEHELTNLRLAAILHDAGKIAVKDDVLLKSGFLTSDEFGRIMQHSTFGAEILSHIKEFKDIIPGIRYHHEKYDGSGYPEGLKGTDIPVIARIIAVADSFDAMTTDRSYRRTLGYKAAFEELKNNAGIQFDPIAVKYFLEIYETPDATNSE